MNKTGFDRMTTTTPNPASLRRPRQPGWQAAGGLLLGLGLTLSLGAQPGDQVAPSPKAPGQTGIVAPDAEAEPKMEDARTTDDSIPNVTADESARLNAVLITSLKGIAFTSNPEGAGALGPVAGVSASEDLPLLAGDAFRAQVAANYLGKPVTLANINALNREVVAFLKTNGLPVVDVIVPEQDITAGTLRLIVLQGRLGQVSVKGNKWFSGERLAAQVRTAPGDVLTAGTIIDDLNWLNQNPFRRVGLVYTRGQEVGTTDIILQVEDRRPLRFYIGYEDSGNDATGNNRYLAGVNWGDAFGRGHQLNYQFTTTDDYNDFYAHSASYVVPLPWRHTLTTYAAYANSSAEVVAGALNADGESYSAGLRYAVPLPGANRLNHEAFAGYDYKFSQNALIFGGTTLPATKTEVSQFNIGYAANLRDGWGATALTATLFVSPGDMTPHNDSGDFQAVSGRSSDDYQYGRITLERLTRLPSDFSLIASVTGQISSSNLLVSEQLGAGGYSTVRGYNEREANADEGVLTRLELRTPSMSLGKIFDLGIPADQLQLLTFWDYAALSRHEDLAPPVDNSFTLSSAGVGLRYSVSTYLSLRLDYGWHLKDTSFGDQGDSRGHIGLVLSY